MKNINIQITVALMMLSHAASYTQAQIKYPKTASSSQPYLKIGDKIPDTYFSVQKYKTGKIRLTELKSKLILLDMWGTFCGSCIEHMPDIERLQRQFKESVQVVMVTKNSNAEVEKCALRAENVKNNHLPFINGKEQLAGFFNLSFVPQYVWINSEGIIKYISEEADVTPENIRRFTAGKKLDLKIKANLPTPNGIDPLIVQNYPYLGNNFYIYSYLAPLDHTQYTTGSSERNGLKMEKYKSISGNSFNFKSLYKLAFGFSFSDQPFHNDRVILNFKDTTNFSDSSKAYFYEIIAHRKISAKRVMNHIRSELDLFFDVDSRLEKHPVTCFVLRKINNGGNYNSVETDTNRFDKVGNSILKVTLPWGKFLKWVNGVRFVPPHSIIDETGIDLKTIVNFQMGINFNDLEGIQRSLAPYGLTIFEAKKEMDCIVIRDVN